jgi:hypothetical protein
MLAATPLFVAGVSDRLADLALNCLAVAGGYLAGHVLGGLVAWGLDRWVFARKSPDFVKKLAQVVCGIALAILVALIVFGKGGGTGGGSGEGTGKGAGDPDGTPGKVDVKQADDKRPPVKVQPPKAADVEASTPQVRVTFLAGDAVRSAPRAEDSKLYYIGDEPVLRTFAEVKAAVEAKKREAGGRQVLLVVLYPADPTRAAPERSPNVTQVTEWAEANGVRVVLGTGAK